MAKGILKWSLTSFCDMLKQMQEKQFDCILFIEGNRGLGKSTLGYLISNKILKNFNPWRDIIYSREDVLKEYNRRERSVIFADELVNVSYNRDFYIEDQKRLIKLMNMNRDKCNIFIGCIPNFGVIDTQMKDLCKIRITVVRRGIAVIQTQNRLIYSRDKWDISLNEKIERQWNRGGITKPSYGKLTTSRGLLLFKDLTDKQKEEYQRIKDKKRHQLSLNEDIYTPEEKGEIERLIERIRMGKIDKDGFKEYCLVMGRRHDSMMKNINNHLRKAGEDITFRDLFPPKKKLKGTGGKSTILTEKGVDAEFDKLTTLS